MAEERKAKDTPIYSYILNTLVLAVKDVFRLYSARPPPTMDMEDEHISYPCGEYTTGMNSSILNLPTEKTIDAIKT